MSTRRPQLVIPPAPPDVVRSLARNTNQPIVVDPDAPPVSEVDHSSDRVVEQSNTERGRANASPALALKQSSDRVIEQSSDVSPIAQRESSSLAVIPDVGAPLALPGEEAEAERVSVTAASSARVSPAVSVRRSGKVLLTGAVAAEVFAFVDDRWTSLRDSSGRRRYRDRGEYLNAVLQAVIANEALVMEFVAKLAAERG